MGLDNGIMLKIESGKLPDDFPGTLDDFNIAWLKDHKELEVCYWRKCWGIRGAIMEVLHMNKDNSEHKIDAEDVPAIRRKLIQFMHPNYWEEEADSIWTYDEFAETLIQQLLNLKWLEKYLKDHPDAECVFYDSY